MNKHIPYMQASLIFLAPLLGLILSLSIAAPVFANSSLPGLILHWKLNSTSGTRAEDSSGNENHGTVIQFNPSTWSIFGGVFGGTLLRQGTNQYVTTSFVGPTGDDPRTIAYWKKTSTSTTQFDLSYGATTPEAAFNVGTGFSCEGVTVDASDSAITYTAEVDDGQWHHYAFVVPNISNPTLADVRVFRDGVRLTTTCATHSHTDVLNTASTTAVQVARHFNGSNYTIGNLDELRVYNRALSDTEVIQLVAAPGGVVTGLKYWLRPQEVSGSPGNPVTNWDDFHRQYIDEQFDGQQIPHSANGINFHSTALFNGSGFMYFRFVHLLFGATAGTIFYMLQNTGSSTQSDGYPSEFGGGGPTTPFTPTWKYDFSDGQIYSGWGSTARKIWDPRAAPAGGPPRDIRKPLIYSVMSRTGEWTARFNGVTNFTTTANTRSFGASPSDGTVIGAATNGDFNPSGYAPFRGKLSEIAVYQRNLSEAERLRVQTYYALKYGATLGTRDIPVNYVASDGTVLWDATTHSAYVHDVMGIGRDDFSTLYQKQSRSTNDTNVLTIGLGEIAVSNVANANSFSADKSIMVMGHDNSTTTNWTITGVPTNYERVARTWHVEETGTVGTTTVAFNVANTAANIPDAISGYYLLRDTNINGDFADEDPILLYDNGTNGDVTAGDNQYSVNTIDFADGEEFTIATFAGEYGVEVIVADSLTSESGGTGSFQIELLAKPTAPVTIALSSSNTSEGTTTPSITIQPDDWDNPSANVVMVYGVDDDPDVSDGAIEYTIVTGDVTSADANFDALGDGDVDDVSMTNQNNDPPGIVVTVVDNTTGEDGSTARVRFTLLTQPATMDADVTIPLVISDATEGSASSSMTIDFDNWNNAAANEVTITGLDDSLDDGDIIYQLLTGDPASTDPDYDALIATDIADPSLTNADDDGPGVQVAETDSSSAATEGGATDSMSLQLTSQPAPGNVVVVNLEIPADLDLGSGSGTMVQLTFDNDDWDQPQNVNVAAADNSLLDGTRTPQITFGIDHDATTEDSYDHLHLHTSGVIVTVTDNDTATATLSAANGSEEGPSGVIFSVALDRVNNTGSTIIFDINPSGGTATVGSDYANFADSTVSVANGSAAGILNVTVIDDADDDDNETVEATISNPSFGAVTIGTAEASASIVDNDEQADGGGGGSGGGSPTYGCKDENALNYNRFISHRQSLCTYAEDDSDEDEDKDEANAEDEGESAEEENTTHAVARADTAAGNEQTEPTITTGSSIPAQLFDIRLLVADQTLRRAVELVAQVTFTSFGSEPTPVDMAFSILNAEGEEVWRSTTPDTITVETEAVFTKDFTDLTLPEGSYTLFLRTLYNTDVEDIFEAPFTVSTGAAAGPTCTTWWFLCWGWWILIVSGLFFAWCVWRWWAKDPFAPQ